MDEIKLITDQTIPSGTLKSIAFDLMTNEDIKKLCEVRILEANDVASAKLGLPHASFQCGTCGSKQNKDCDGHYGFVKLPKAIYHPFFATEIVHILNQICPGCKCVKKYLLLKVPSLNPREIIYKKLHNLENETAAKQNIYCKQQSKHFSFAKGVETIGPLSSEAHVKERSFSKGKSTDHNVHSKWRDNSACGFHAKTFEVRPKSASKGSSPNAVEDMRCSLRTILHEYSFDECLDEKDKSLLIEALNYHPNRDAKIGSGIQDIKVGHNPSHPSSRCFVIVRRDGTLEDFSYHKCVNGAANLVSPEFGSFVHEKNYHRR